MYKAGERKEVFREGDSDVGKSVLQQNQNHLYS